MKDLDGRAWLVFVESCDIVTVCRVACTARAFRSVERALLIGSTVSLDSAQRLQLWHSLLRPDAMARVWSLGVDAMGEAVRAADAADDFVVVPAMRRMNSTAAVAGLDTGLAGDAPLEAFEQLAPPCHARAGSFDFYYEDEPGYGLAVVARVGEDRDDDDTRKLRECAACGFWFVSASGRRHRCLRCRTEPADGCSAAVFVSPAPCATRARTFEALVAAASTPEATRSCGAALTVIAVDVPRTAVNPRERRELERLLRAFAVLTPGVGYCQGMSHIAYWLLRRFENTERAFWAFVSLLHDHGLKSFFLPGLRRARIACYQLERLTQERLPLVAQHLATLGVPYISFGMSWCQTLFSNSLDPAALDVVWDAFLSVKRPAKNAFLLSVMLALLSDLDLEVTEPQRAHLVHSCDPRRLLGTAAAFCVEPKQLLDLEARFEDDHYYHEDSVFASYYGHARLRRRHNLASNDKDGDEPMPTARMLGSPGHVSRGPLNSILTYLRERRYTATAAVAAARRVASSSPSSGPAVSLTPSPPVASHDSAPLGVPPSAAIPHRANDLVASV